MKECLFNSKKTIIVSVGLLLLGSICAILCNVLFVSNTDTCEIDKPVDIEEKTIELIKKNRYKDFTLFRNFDIDARSLDDEGKWRAVCYFKIDTFSFEYVPLKLPFFLRDTNKVKPSWIRDSLLVKEIVRMAKTHSITYEAASEKIEKYIGARMKLYEELGYARVDGLSDSTCIYISEYLHFKRKDFVVVLDSLSKVKDTNRLSHFMGGKRLYDKFYYR